MGLFDMSAFYSAMRTKHLEDTFVMLFHTRDIRGGKGQRYEAMEQWAKLIQDPATRPLALNLLDLIPEYGCWQDIFKMPHEANSRVLDIVLTQIQQDEVSMTEGGKVSLLAKWMPREGQPMAVDCACKLVPGKMFLNSRMKFYRKRITNLCRALKTVESKMCKGNWEEILPEEVPRRALKKYRKALLNRSLHMNAIRYPNSEVRMACREHFQEYFSDTALYNPTTAFNRPEDSRYDLVRNRVRKFLEQPLVDGI